MKLINSCQFQKLSVWTYDSVDEEVKVLKESKFPGSKWRLRRRRERSRREPWRGGQGSRLSAPKLSRRPSRWPPSLFYGRRRTSPSSFPVSTASLFARLPRLGLRSTSGAPFPWLKRSYHLTPFTICSLPSMNAPATPPRNASKTCNRYDEFTNLAPPSTSTRPVVPVLLKRHATLKLIDF